MTSSFPVLFALGGELIGLAFIIFFVLGPILKQAFAKVAEAEKKDARPRRPVPPNMRAGQPNPPRPGAGQGDPLGDEIGEFLRKASGQRAAGPPRRAAPPRRPQPAPQPPEAELVLMDRHESVSEHVRSHVANQVRTDLDESQFAGRSAQLGAQVGQSDERLEERLHDKFDHQLGAFANESGSASAVDTGEPVVLSEVSAAAGLSALLGSQVRLRQAIILHEIMQRPKDRW